MKNLPVQFKYSLGQDVVIRDLGLTARIFARCDRGNDLHDYRVIWWAESKRNDEWLYQHELEAKP